MNCNHFLIELFVAGKSYSVLNSARSALSILLISSSGLTIGNSPSLKRILKGVFELRSPFSRNNFISDISVVLDFLIFYYPLECMHLDMLTYKFVILLVLSSLQRVQTLLVIYVSCVLFLHNPLFLSIETLLKQSSL